MGQPERQSGHALAGFTLAELLIALAILGIIATFVIPKVLSSQQDSKYNAIAMETNAMIAQAWQAYSLRNTTSGTNALTDLIPLLNYVATTTAPIDSYYNSTATIDCNSASYQCFKLHSGAVIALSTSTFNASGVSIDAAGTKGVSFFLDPDGAVTDGTATGPGKSVCIILGYNGRTITPFNGLLDPPWFHWGSG